MTTPTPDEITSFREILMMTTMKQTWTEAEVITELQKENRKKDGKTNLELLRIGHPTFGFP